jgi:hypothetical protein
MSDITISNLPLDKWVCDNITFFMTSNDDGEICLLAIEPTKLMLFAFEVEGSIANCIYYSGFYLKEPVPLNDLTLSFETIETEYSAGSDLPEVSLSSWLKIEARILAHPLIDKVRPYFIVCGEV